MQNSSRTKVVFKDYSPNQLLLLPPSLEEMTDPNHPVDVEAVFGIIKGNRNYRKFLLRGLEKVEIEVGLLALSHNLSKIASSN